MSWLKPTSFLIYVTQKKRSCFVFNFSAKRRACWKSIPETYWQIVSQGQRNEKKRQMGKDKKLFFRFGNKK